MDSLATDFEKHSDASLQDSANLIDKVSENKAKETSTLPSGTSKETIGDSGGDEPIVSFDEAALISNRVFNAVDDQPIQYTLRNDTKFLYVNLLADSADIDARKKTFQYIANATYDENDEKFDDIEGPFTVNATHAVLKSKASAFQNYYGNAMYLNITWQFDTDDETQIGSSWTTYFTVDDDASADAAQRRQELLNESQEDNGDMYEKTSYKGPLQSSTGREDIENPGLSGDGDGGGPDSSSNDDNGSSSNGDSSSGGGGGMSTGATAGAAVGGVVGGLLIIGAIVWFLLRRRRQKKFQDDRSGEQTYVVDKETQGRSTDSPNMGYTDGGHTTKPIPLESINHEREDSAIPRNSLGARSRGGNSGVQTPQGISSNVAHLVEDGMTADEIRRLEEEERQLDDEIERAARR